jgi:Lon protease-like protein
VTANPFSTDYQSLPATLPIFPLTGVLLLPGGRLPLNIFEPRYLAMISDALGGQRLIGMVQPLTPGGFAGDGLSSSDLPPPVQKIGCAGRIVSFTETGDGRVLVTLLGLCRFAATGEERLAPGGYRLAQVDYGNYRADMAKASTEVDRPRLLAALRRFFTANNLSVDWQALEQLDDAALVGTVSMVAPLEPLDKQALLEAQDGTTRGKVLIGLLESAQALAANSNDAPRH